MTIEPKQIKLDAAEAQLLAMALAHLAVERPGWHEMLKGFAASFDVEGYFDRFFALRCAGFPDAQDDMILQLRTKIDSVNPMLWAMVAEICWPGAR